MLLIGYFEGLDSERAIGWRVADSMSVRAFLEYDPEEAPPDHSTLSRTRRLIDVETHRAVFTWVLERLSEAKLVRGRTIGIDATTLEANAAMRSIVRRDTGEGYEAFVKRLAEASGVETPTRADLARFDRKRRKKTSTKEWKNPHDPDAKITKMKDGRTRLAHKAEEAVDLETVAVVAVTVQGAEAGDTKTMDKDVADGPGGGVGGPAGGRGEGSGGRKGIPQYENRVGLEATGIAKLRVRTGAEGTTTLEGAGGRPTGRLRQPAAPSWRARPAIAAPAERTGGTTVWPIRRETGGLRRIFVRGHPNVRKRLLVHVCGFNLGLLMRQLTGFGTPRSLQGSTVASIGAQLARWSSLERLLKRCCASIRPDPSIVASQIHRYTI